MTLATTISDISPQVAALELLARRAARASYLKYIEETTELAPAAHHRLLIDRLQAVAEGRCKRLMVFMPPGSAKSHYANVHYAAYWIGRNPTKNVITASYGQELADKWGRRSRNIVAGPQFRRIFGIGLDAGSTAANRWATDQGGEYLAVGVGGPVTGNRADLAIIDDPVKGREEADSETIREKTREWYRDDLWTRLKPDAAVIIIMTRWHEDDLAGWLLSEAEKGGEAWEVISLPAIAEQNDPLGRAPGEPLWPEWFTTSMFTEAKRDSRRWSALYQQRPVPEEGDYFKAAWFRSYGQEPKLLKIYGASDYAVTADGGDYTVHIVVGVDTEDRMYVLDLWRKQADSMEWVEAIGDLVKKRSPMEWAEETGQIKSGVGPFLEKRLAERRAYVYRRQFPTKGDKAVRAQAIRGRMAMLGLYLPDDAEWVSDFKSELLAFPAGKHDDQVDALGLIGQLLDHISIPKEPEKPKDPKFDYEGRGNMIYGNTPIRELIRRQERRGQD